jgi:hypothetical protein
VGNQETAPVGRRVPAEPVTRWRRSRGLLDGADECCRAGEHLLTLAAPAPVVAYRRWLLDEIATQAAGGPATPWSAGPETENHE